MSHYHDETAYSPGEVGGHVLDWANQPSPFKYYKSIEPLPMPEPRFPQAGFWDLALGWPPRPADGPYTDAAALAGLLLLTGGISQRAGNVGLRTAASAGALYPCELYVATSGVAGLADGLHHFEPSSAGLQTLWPANLAAHLAEALGGEPAGLSFFISAIYWRSLWKYRTRAYRYCLLDAGHMLANLELACAAHGLTARTILGFPDKAAGVLVGAPDDDEGVMAVAQAGPPPADAGPADAGLPPLDLAAQPLGGVIGRDRRVLAAHGQGELFVAEAEPVWPVAEADDARPLPAPATDGVGFFDVARLRRSRRNFIPAAISGEQLSALLAAALPAPGPLEARLLLAGGRGVAMGAFDYLPGRHALRPVAPGVDARSTLAGACLGQLWVGQAALILALWADLDKLEDDLGPRGYRRAMIAAGRAGQRLYLAATALGLGCCGVGAFFDDRAAQAAFLPPGGRMLYLLACGPVKGL